MFEYWETPRNYRNYPGGESLPDKVKVWRIMQKSDSREQPYSTVCRSWGFDDSPDAEALTPGYNTAKENGAVGVGRHGNFLYWGFSGPPSKFTEAGSRFFLNCICYIAKFNGKLPLVRRESGHRFEPVRLAMARSYISDEDFFKGVFQPDLDEKYKGDWKGLMRQYEQNIEFIYRDNRMYKIDAELKDLGLSSNRTLATLESLIALLRDNSKSGIAAGLLKRYTLESFEKPEQWEAWLKENKDRIYFSDIGGYKFRVIPKGYLD